MSDRPSLFRGFRIGTTIINDCMIQQDTYFDDGLRDDYVSNIQRKVINLQDQQIHDALVKLGWTPPPKGFCRPQ